MPCMQVRDQRWREHLLHRDSLKDLLSQPGFTRTDKVLVCLAVDLAQAKQVRDITNMAKSAGLRAVVKWNVSALLAASRGKAVRTREGWELTSAGLQHVAKRAGPHVGSPTPKIATGLRGHLARLRDPQTSAFVEEAVKCLENHLFRAAIVLSWVGAISVMYEHTISKHLAAFNSEASRRSAKWKAARTLDDLSRMKEYDFLQVLEAISILGKNLKQELEACLRLRNACGHPSSLRISENRVAAHIETLILNVFDVFK